MHSGVYLACLFQWKVALEQQQPTEVLIEVLLQKILHSQNYLKEQRADLKLTPKVCSQTLGAD